MIMLGRAVIVVSLVAATACAGSVEAPYDLDGDSGPLFSGDDGPGDSGPAPADTGGDALQSGDGDGDSAPTDADPPDPQPTAELHFIGRFDTSDPQGPRFQWPGSGVVARFSGTGVSVRLSGGTDWYAWTVDDDPVGTLHYAGQTNAIALASGLSAGEHTVRIFRRDESFFGTSQFRGFTVSGGQLVASVFPFSHRMMVIGDSITCGYGNEGDSPTCPFTQDTENNYLAYASIAARDLDAALHTIAWSGKGIYREYGGGTTDQMPVLFDRTLPTEATSTVDHAAYVPEVIVINLGTNDFSAGDPGVAYETAYIAFTARLRSLYPNAFIICAIGPMNTSDIIQERIGNVVDARTTNGDARISFMAFDPQETGGIGCDYHPNTITHMVMAERLVTEVRTITGW